MAYIVYKWVGKYRYAYLQRSFRRDGKVKTDAVYIGRVSGLRDGPSGGDLQLSKLAGLAAEARREMWEKTPEGKASRAKWDGLKKDMEDFRAASDARMSVNRQRAKAEEAQAARKVAAEKEVRDVKHAKPTDADETDLANRIERWQAEHAQRSAEYASSGEPQPPPSHDDEVPQEEV